MASKFVTDTAAAANPWKAHFNETPFEAESRTTANFGEIESQMPARFSGSEVSFLDKASSTYLPAWNRSEA